jgi:hypothetical protein
MLPRCPTTILLDLTDPDFMQSISGGYSLQLQLQLMRSGSWPC